MRKLKLGDAYENDKYLEGYYRVKYEEKLAEYAGQPNQVQLAVNAMQQVFLPDCDPHDPATNDSSESTDYPGTLLKGPNGTVTHPGKISADMKYARWYPTQVTLPTNQILIYSGWDRDERFYPQPATADWQRLPGRHTRSHRTFAALRRQHESNRSKASADRLRPSHSRDERAREPGRDRAGTPILRPMDATSHQLLRC